MLGSTNSSPPALRIKNGENSDLGNWGAIGPASGYTDIGGMTYNGGSVQFAAKNGQGFIKLDGVIYQNEGNERCIDSALSPTSIEARGVADGYWYGNFSTARIIYMRRSHQNNFVFIAKGGEQVAYCVHSNFDANNGNGACGCSFILPKGWYYFAVGDNSYYIDAWKLTLGAPPSNGSQANVTGREINGGWTALEYGI